MSSGDPNLPIDSVALLERVVGTDLKVFEGRRGEVFRTIEESNVHTAQEGDVRQPSCSSKDSLSNEVTNSGGEKAVSEVSDFSPPPILPPQSTSSHSFTSPSTSSAPPPPYPCNPPPVYLETPAPQLFYSPTPKPLRISSCSFLRFASFEKIKIKKFEFHIFFAAFLEYYFFMIFFSKEPYASFNTQSPYPITFADVFDGFLMTRVHKDPQASVLSRGRVARENKLVGFL